LGGGIATGCETVATEEVSIIFIDAASKIDDFEDLTVGGDSVCFTFIEVIKKGLGRDGEHDIVGVEVVVGEMERFLVGNEGHDHLKEGRCCCVLVDLAADKELV